MLEAQSKFRLIPSVSRFVVSSGLLWDTAGLTWLWFQPPCLRSRKRCPPPRPPPGGQCRWLQQWRTPALPPWYPRCRHPASTCPPLQAPISAYKSTLGFPLMPTSVQYKVSRESVAASFTWGLICFGTCFAVIIEALERGCHLLSQPSDWSRQGDNSSCGCLVLFDQGMGL